MKNTILSMSTLVFSASLMAADPPATVLPPESTDLDDIYFSTASKNLSLTPQEKAAIAISKKWQADSAASTKPVAGADGSVRFLYGANQPSIVCAVLQVCDVSLQAGEQVQSINLGDSNRWVVEPAISGVGADQIQHIIIKPMDVGLETSLIVTTDRRTYYFKLRSHRDQYMAQISFTYPEEATAKWEAMKQQEIQERIENTIPETGEYLGDLDFNYKISGNASWKPVRVYNDGVKTIIQMSKEMAQTEAPTLLVVRDKGGLFSDDETVMVNYRVQGDRYVVDTVFDEAMLIAGVGRRQDRVTIERSR
jgi:P-type conjugative transfer protein TrbG